MRVERLPFTVYDVLGYFFPGLLFLMGLLHFVPAITVFIEAHGQFISGSFIKSALGVVLLIVAAYTAGHIISWVATRIIEKMLVVPLVGYPSQYLLNEAKTGMLCPRPLGRLAKSRVLLRFEKEFGATIDSYDSHDWFEMIEHFVRNRNFGAAARMYNYVVLYGFLRNTALVLLVFGLWSLWRAACGSPNWGFLIPLVLLISGT